MKIYTYHAKVKKDFDFTNLISQLTSQEEIKLVAIMRNYEEGLKKKLSCLDTSISFPIFQDPNHGILLSEIEKILISMQLFLYPRILEVKIFSGNENKFTSLLELIRNFNGVGELNFGTLLESDEVERFNEELKLSPHGKKLTAKKYEKAFTKLYNHKIREILSEIIETYGGLPMMIEMLKDIKIVKKEKKIVDRILKDSSLISKSYMIACSECYSPSLVVFNTKANADKALENVQYICPHCKKSSPEIIETFYIREEVIYALKEGLWLEKFVDQIMREETKNVWSGVMKHPNELDTVAILTEQTFLIECKASFGQNDFYVLLGKAGAVDANIIIIVTSKEIHENVKSLISEYEKEGERRVYLIESNTTEKIRLELKDILRKEKDKYFEAIFEPEHRYMLRSFPLKPRRRKIIRTARR